MLYAIFIVKLKARNTFLRIPVIVILCFHSKTKVGIGIGKHAKISYSHLFIHNLENIVENQINGFEFSRKQTKFDYIFIYKKKRMIYFKWWAG